MMTFKGRVVYERKQHHFQPQRIAKILKSFGEDMKPKEFSRFLSKVVTRSIEELGEDEHNSLIVVNGIVNYIQAYRRTWYVDTFFGWILRIGLGDPETIFQNEIKQEAKES